MPITMHKNLRTQDRYRFLKGKITQINNQSVVIQPYGSSEQTEAYFDPQVTYFWKGGLTFTKTVTGAVGDQGTVSAFRDDATGRLLVETLMVNHEQVRGTITGVNGNTLAVKQPKWLATLNPEVTLSLRPDALDFYDNRVDFSQFKAGQNVIAQGEILNPGQLDIYRIHIQ
ncbi:hypothetical protein AAC03nite_13070 [Alicyclobacillus acidoterrestris]|uniref:hypothetical protein n=1 Tax=Alicyclobacillus suci TaxID=2816080 RepID=UPI0011908875|nr:hypothetical protein [Alicyclobacillus suci]GEO25522.1 hypothetical protein AAC03nite_13070 [Alicyclobacillus acidoterrestris]